MHDVVLSLQQVSVKRGQRCVLAGCNFDFKTGQFIAILGENGAGKSTLLQAIAGDLTYHGTMTYRGRELRQWSARELATERAVMEQQAYATAGLTVAELVALGRYARGEWHGESVAACKQAIAPWLETFKLTALAQRELTELSGGELQRTHMARCLAQLDDGNQSATAKLLLLDEPTAALDVYHQHLSLQQAQAFARNGHLVIAIMHDLNLASVYADQVLLLQHGEPCACGRPTDVLQPQRLHELYNQPMHVSQHPQLGVPMIFSEPHTNSRMTRR